MDQLSSPTNATSPLPAWNYPPVAGHYDEMNNGAGQLRPHWRHLLASITTMGAEEMARRWNEGRRLIHDNGVTYNVYGDPLGMDRPWELDALPLVIAPDEWRQIEAAVIQRARLLNTVLADLYGPQRLLHDGLLPPELVYANPGFLRACHGHTLPGRNYLHIYAADLCRGPDGVWSVLSDRTQAPSGAGYALENRLVLSRMLPDVFRDCHVQRLAPFFQSYKDMLMRMAPAHRENPRIVLLTPGPYNETFFEHAYLARYLGCTLVEGGDLTVRDSRVFLKTLGRLLPVDVILRRLDDNFCDQLELRGDSTLGVPGLLQAVRSGNVAIANALGSGLVETAAILSFLPTLCQRLLGEDLKMRSCQTWWCGQDEARLHVLDRLDQLVIKTTFRKPGDHSIFGEKLRRQAKNELVARILAQPYQFVAQERAVPSIVPAWNDGGLVPRQMLLRVFAVATEDSYTVMPGGLTRITASMDMPVVSMQRGAGSKDTWVQADAPVAPFSLLKTPTHPIDVSRASFDLPSRVADNFFWLGRQVERVDAGVRLVRTALTRLTDEWGPASASSLPTITQMLIRLGLVPEDATTGNGQATSLEQELISVIFDRQRRAGLRWNVSQLHGVAWLLRDRMSNDAWRMLSRLDQDFSRPPPRQPLQVTSGLDLLDRAMIYLSAFSGQVMESMTRGQGWRLVDIGRRLERAIHVVDLLRYGVLEGAECDSARLEAILEIADSIITYRSRYLTSMQTELVVDLLLIDEANPRSVAFQLVTLSNHLSELPQRNTPARRSPESRLVLSALTSLRVALIEELCRVDEAGHRSDLEAMLTRLTDELPAVSNELTRAYLSHALPLRQLNSPWSEPPA